ncbi:hypothetical protein QTG56_08265 [Rossellomorea sp. AcN35-11]|nr:hypothetical protein QTG56_08265 [Rossellomorea sp. AcN35-11]
MSSVLLCYTITKQLKEVMDQVNSENRDASIEEIQSLLEKKDRVYLAPSSPRIHKRSSSSVRK